MTPRSEGKCCKTAVSGGQLQLTPLGICAVFCFLSVNVQKYLKEKNAVQAVLKGDRARNKGRNKPIAALRQINR